MGQGPRRQVDEQRRRVERERKRGSGLEEAMKGIGRV